jgi:hypothetical protein
MLHAIRAETLFEKTGDASGFKLPRLNHANTQTMTQSAAPTASNNTKRHQDIPSIPARMPLSWRRTLKNRANNTVA